jgi:hypothetical protein
LRRRESVGKCGKTKILLPGLKPLLEDWLEGHMQREVGLENFLNTLQRNVQGVV